jgi:hypothetical protein
MGDGRKGAANIKAALSQKRSSFAQIPFDSSRKRDETALTLRAQEETV